MTVTNYYFGETNLKKFAFEHPTRLKRSTNIELNRVSIQASSVINIIKCKHEKK